MEYPIRINKYLKEKGFCSRRQADRFIEEGRVEINGKPAELGQQVEGGDVVEVDKKVAEAPENYQYYLFNKPQDVVSINPQRGEVGPYTTAPELEGTSPVGRLDKDSRGLMLFTDDGRIVNKLLNPKFDHEKEYRVKVNKPLSPNFKKRMENGIDIEGYTTKPATLRILGDKIFSITLTEGKKHQIRRMVTALGYEVEDLKRTRIMNLKINNLKEGDIRPLTEQEKEKLLSSLGVSR
ncbi:MAG: pseudouridine synthase [Candidatus Paceibacterota bacterium]